MVDVRIIARADLEYRKAYRYYSKVSPTIASRFKAEFFRGKAWMAEFLEASPLCDERHRYYIMKKFPYGIVYEFKHNTAWIVAVTHFRQLPGYWLT